MIGARQKKVYALTVINNNGNLSAGGGQTLSETTDEQRSDEGKGRRVDLGNEGGGSKELDGLGDLLLGLDEALDCWEKKVLSKE